LDILGMPSGIDPEDILGEIPLYIRRAILLYNRCVIFGTELALPGSGGVLDQHESIVQVLEAIHLAVQEDKIRRQEDEEFKYGQKMRVLQSQVSGSAIKRT